MNKVRAGLLARDRSALLKVRPGRNETVLLFGERRRVGGTPRKL
jgi:hypothetical protein